MCFLYLIRALYSVDLHSRIVVLSLYENIFINSINARCQMNLGKPVGETILYYGCRKKTEDFIYEEELNEYVKNNSLKVFKQIVTSLVFLGSFAN